MGFHNRHVSERVLKITYKTLGVKGILDTFKTDAVVTSDSFSSQVAEFFRQYSRDRDHDRLEKQIETFFSVN